VATRTPIALPVPPPTDAEVAALETVRAYLARAGTQVASRVLGCPSPTGEVAALADLGNALLASATLCAGLLDLPDDQRRL
jgi:hypothetical protein